MNIVENRCNAIKEILIEKGAEYHYNGDPFYAFNAAARYLLTSPEEALRGMMVKHQVSLDNIINDIRFGKDVSEDMISEKVGDYINYLVILEALLYKRINRTI